MFSTTTRYTGTSGIDVTSMVDAMMQAESMKYNKLNQNVEYLKWQQEEARSLGNDVKSFQKSFLSLGSAGNIRSTSTFNSSTAKVTTGASGGTIGIKPGNTKPGNHTVTVEQKATNEIRQGTTVGSKSSEIKTGEITADTINKMNAGDSFTINYDGVNTTFSFSQADIDYMKEDINLYGVNPAKSMRDMMQSKLTAKYGSYNGEPKVGVTANSDGTLSFKVPEALGVSMSISADNTVRNNTITSSLVMPTGDNKFTADQVKLNPTYMLNGKEVNIAVDETTTGKDYIAALQAEVDKVYGDSNVIVGQDDKGRVTFTSTRNTPADANISASYNTTTTVTDPDTGEETTTTKTNMVIGSQDADGKAVAVGLKPSSQNMGGVLGIDPKHNSNKINTSTMTMADMVVMSGGKAPTEATAFVINGKSIIVSPDDTVDKFMSKVNGMGAGVTISFNKNSNSFKLEGKSQGEMNAINTSDPATGNPHTNTNYLLGVLGLNTVTQKAQDAKMTVDGESVIRDSNKFTYDGMEFDLTDSKAVAGTPETYDIKVESDTESTFNSIKAFVDGYNAMITALQDATNTTRPKSGSYSYYEPLTDEQKESMSDSEIEKWEKSAKTGILYGDSEFQRLTRDLRGAMNSSVKLADGSSISLASIGITTEGWETGGKLVIDEDKLKKSLEERPDDVKTLFTQTDNGIGDKLNKAVDKAVGSNGYISKKVGFEGTIYVTENEMSRKIEQQNKDLAELQKQLAAKEDHYYTLFAAMEKAVNESNSQMSYLMSAQ